MKNKLTKLMILFICLSITSLAHAVPTAKITYKIVSLEGEPISGVKVRVGFRSYIGGSKNPTVEEGLTDEDGMFTASGSTQYEVTASIKKEGYYISGNTFGGNDFTDISGIMGFRRWEPWNPTITVVLKKIKEPVALYMRNVGSKTIYKDIDEDPSSYLTVIGQYIGYDLVASDWVVPHGSGLHRDFLFKLDKEYRSPSNFKHILTLKFDRQGDGIQPYYTAKDNASIFKVPYHAPLNGYKDSLVQVHESDSNKIYQDDFGTNQNYFFRIRTELDDKGNVISALYGKIEGNIRFPSGTERPLARLKFKYFLNPTPNDTNLEFDETKNLFGDKRHWGRRD